MHYIYPGCFDPPHFGHSYIVQRLCEIFPFIHIVCSRNPDKNSSWFTPEECVEMWNSYLVSDRIEITTYDNLVVNGPDLKSIILIKGIRDQNDLADGNKFIDLNHTQLGINKYFYFLTDRFKEVSSSQLKKDIMEGKDVAQYVTKFVKDQLIEKHRSRLLKED